MLLQQARRVGGVGQVLLKTGFFAVEAQQSRCGMQSVWFTSHITSSHHLPKVDLSSPMDRNVCPFLVFLFIGAGICLQKRNPRDVVPKRNPMCGMKVYEMRPCQVILCQTCHDAFVKRGGPVIMFFT